MKEWHSHGIDHLQQFNNLCFSGSFGEILGLLMSSDKIWVKVGFGLNIALKKSYFDIMLYSMMMGYDDYSNDQHIFQRTIRAIGLFLEL